MRSSTFTTIPNGGGIHPTFTVRTMPSNNYFVYEDDEGIRNEPDEGQEGQHHQE